MLTLARCTVTLGIVVFWAGVALAGQTAAGYSARTDVISSLAGRGSSVATLGVVAILVLVPVHLAAAWTLRQVHRSRLAPRLLVAGAGATALIAVFRVSCPSGAAGCDQEPTGADLVDLGHGFAVVAYALVIVAAMGSVAVRAGRGSSSWPRWTALVSAVAAVGSLLLVARTGGSDAGMWQRLWVGSNLGWLLLVTWTGGIRPPAPADGRRPRR